MTASWHNPLIDTLLTISPFLIPVVLGIIIVLGRRSDEDEKYAILLGSISAVVAAGIYLYHASVAYAAGVGLAASAAAAAIYVVYRRREEY